MKKIYFVFLFVAFFNLFAIAQKAELHIVNNSERLLTLKIMRDGGTSEDSKYSILTVSPHTSSTEYFSETGHYYLKTKAEKTGTETIYKKGDPFEVYVGSDGYSVLTITYTIKESNVKNPMEGKEISKSEFERNN